MVISLSVALMHDPRRADRLLALLERLDQSFPLAIVEDSRQEGLWPTAKRAWKAIAPEATHHLVLQDDILPCLDFLPAVAQAIITKPDEPLSFYANRAVIDQARQQGSSWARISRPLFGQANCFPVAMVRDFLSWEEQHVKPSLKFDDSRIAMYLLAHHRPIWTTVPSLVEHVGAYESLLGHAGKIGKYERVARWFLGADRSGLEIDWTRGSENPPWDKNGSLADYTSWLKESE